MYRCEACGKVVPPGTTARRRVVETRERTYPSRQNANGRSRPQRPGARRPRSKGDPGGTGTEIVREQLVCADCAAQDE